MHLLCRGGGGGGEDVKGGAPKYFLALNGGALKVIDILGGGGVMNFSKFWFGRGLECSLPP